MEFGPVPLSEALGAVLAHSVKLSDGRLRKGLVLSARDIERLAGAGLDQVTVARLQTGDADENTAAARLAAALAPDPERANIRLTAAATGRVNVYATALGVLDIDAGAIHAANRIDPMITIATLPPFARVRPGTMVATVKLIAYGVAGDRLAQTERVCAAAMNVRPVVLRRAALVMSDIGDGPGKGEAAIRDRLAGLEMELVSTVTVPHRIEAISEALAASDAELALILTASATSDINDVAPEAVRRAGGRVERFGMPVDPGNLLFLGELDGRAVVGLPGCARSPALNGADWVLERVCCGIPVRDDDIAAMGVGGLLKESPARPHPREGADAAKRVSDI